MLDPEIYRVISEPWRKPQPRGNTVSENKIPLKPYTVKGPDGKTTLAYGATGQGAIAAVKATIKQKPEEWSAALATPAQLIEAGRANAVIVNDPSPAPAPASVVTADGSPSPRTATE